MWKKTLCYFFGISSSIAITTPTLGADRIQFNYPPFGDFEIATQDLEVFANEGKITKDFAFYANRTQPEQLAQMREFLKTKFQISPTVISQFTYSPIGEKMLQRLGELLQTQNRINGFYALRSALILSAASPEGLSVINIIKNYSSPSIRLNFSESIQTIGQLSQLLQKRDIVVSEIQKIATQEAANVPPIDFAQKPDIRQRGEFNSTKITLTLHDRSRDGKSKTVLERKYDVDVYLPQPKSAIAPEPYRVIVISHGLAEDRSSFVYIAEHLASYGFAVAALDHPVANSKQFQKFLTGIASPPQPTELIDRPLDVKYVLDELQRLNETDSRFKNKLNVQQVGLIGHSLGGYTALALAGGSFDFAKIRQECNPNRSLNISTFLQCRANDLKPNNYLIEDDRIKAIMLMNPLNSVLFGKQGLSKITIPVMMVAGSQDIFTPAVPEQIQPFSQLPSKDKYLALIENATHFSVQSDLPSSETVIPVPQGLLGPDRKSVYSYMNSLGVAFFQTHLSDRQEYKPYITASYAQFISQAPTNLSLVNSDSEKVISQVLNRVYQTPSN
ncbi:MULTISPECIES: alpha/beta hydrolase [Nostoc]|uniref:Alpha/beta hydrolase n=1 Tax=Nostoc paludosum FACHB-159 TaxID=2692908 RepID=A0ABR8KJF8_9NOSO|nr:MULTISPECIES: alpha/beta hydrolase [Nostoc]MBD2681953.1 alpha/beta hydrolase [Nostoc sp. FACHB-857]MBD2738323.1 alpha/beta hydrolase [Nostoc paludosum FACHB-159]